MYFCSKTFFFFVLRLGCGYEDSHKLLMLHVLHILQSFNLNPKSFYYLLILFTPSSYTPLHTSIFSFQSSLIHLLVNVKTFKLSPPPKNSQNIYIYILGNTFVQFCHFFYASECGVKAFIGIYFLFAVMLHAQHPFSMIIQSPPYIPILKFSHIVHSTAVH